MIRIIAALGRNRAIGKNNELLWTIPDDLKRFKQLTLGHPCIMGAKTFESIVAAIGKPLPGRANIVMVREPDWHHERALRASSLDEALEIAHAQEGGEEVFVIGGGQIYALALPRAEILHLTLIEDEREGDTYFPEYERFFPTILSEEAREHDGLLYRFVDLGR